MWEEKRKAIEGVFSVLVDQYLITEIRGNSIAVGEVTIDGILFVYSLVIFVLVER
jgi:hypothetical protein